jgi:hypothetical protein
VEDVHALRFASGNHIPLHYLHLADRTDVLGVVLTPTLLGDDGRQFPTGAFQEIGDSVGVDDSARDNVP